MKNVDADVNVALSVTIREVKALALSRVKGMDMGTESVSRQRHQFQKI